MTTKTYANHGDPDYASKTAAGCEASGEPVFLLRAQDRYAAWAVRAWVQIVRVKSQMAPAPSDALLREMAAAGERIAAAMEAWPHKKEPTL